MKFNLFSRGSVKVTNINIKYQGAQHSMGGMEVKSRFTLTLPFQNKSHSDMLTEAADFKAEKAKPLIVKSLEVASPFKLVSVEPRLPMEVAPDQKVEFKIEIEAPNYKYEGPLNLAFGSDAVELVHVEISKVILIVKGRRTEIETSSRILNIPKNFVFAENVQLLKAMSFGETLSSISTSVPFKFVSADPKLPYKINDPNGPIMSIYIQGPPSQYSGPLEIELG